MARKRTTDKAPNLQALIKDAVLEVVGKLGSVSNEGAGNAPDEESTDETRESNLQLMRDLLARDATKQEIFRAFRTRYAARGKTDKDWVRERIAIYKRLAGKRARKGRSAA